MTADDVAPALVAGTAVVWVAADAVLCRRGARLITDVLRRPLPLGVLVVLTLHVLDLLGPADPFRAAGHLIIPRSADHA